ncbi:hypothetical protein BX600DRAFT_445069 [Xylariales sp. PMI_506]|nr:hypothetical protein BX600DRAFT_445069 [Xylariales sp. PMI_506]
MARDLARDVVRGLTSLEMAFVNVSDLPWTAHSGYVGQITYADTIFPCFAFLSGMSPAPARRSLGLIGLGLSLNTVSAVAYGKHVRLPGVLQRLGLASLIANEPHLGLLRKWNGTPLILLWYAITLLGVSRSNAQNPLAHPNYPAAETSTIAQTRIDKLAFGQSLHTPSFDPEGLLGSLTTAVSMIVGRSFTTANLTVLQKAITATSMVITGESLHFLAPKYAPISKGLWTPSFVLISSGISILKYLAVERAIPYLPVDVQDILQAVGRRSLEAYIISTLLTMLIRLGGEKSILKQGINKIGRITGSAVADFIMSLGLTGTVAVAAKILVARNLKLSW